MIKSSASHLQRIELSMPSPQWTPLMLIFGQDETIWSNSNRATSMHLMALAMPARYSEMNNRRYVEPESHLALPHVRLELLPLLGAHPQGVTAQLPRHHRRVFRFLIKRKQDGRAAYELILIINRHLHGDVVNADNLIGVTCRRVVNYGGVLEPGLLGQCRDGEFPDVKSRPVGTQAEPEDESADAEGDE